ncbi:MAG: hypothetical protein IRY97_05025 [Thermomicrobiaceae bacterium]|nr:hypothetical protein [Thermomicrobiaceae bacterium]
MKRTLRLLCALALACGLLAAGSASAAPITNPSFEKTWNKTDKPVAAGYVKRTWMWGPSGSSGLLVEPYAEAPGGQRLVQYVPKGRMEITHPDADKGSLWYVTTGLLAKELVTGQLQLGDSRFEANAPAQVNIAGDLDDPTAPTYASFRALLGYQPIPTGWTLIQTVDRSGHVGADPTLARYGVTAKDVGAPTHHTVASVFLSFMTSSGMVYDHGWYAYARLFPSAFYATGYPLTEAYWTQVKVGGVSKRVLVQVFERRVLTYTPDNPSGWQVEAGNVGDHYYQWRYVQLGKTATPAPAVDNIDYDCGDFDYPADAQRYFVSQGGSPTNNVDGLDNDHDGIVCNQAVG